MSKCLYLLFLVLLLLYYSARISLLLQAAPSYRSRRFILFLHFTVYSRLQFTLKYRLSLSFINIPVHRPVIIPWTKYLTEAGMLCELESYRQRIG